MRNSGDRTVAVRAAVCLESDRRRPLGPSLHPDDRRTEHANPGLPEACSTRFPRRSTNTGYVSVSPGSWARAHGTHAGHVFEEWRKRERQREDEPRFAALCTTTLPRCPSARHLYTLRVNLMVRHIGHADGGPDQGTAGKPASRQAQRQPDAMCGHRCANAMALTRRRSRRQQKGEQQGGKAQCPRAPPPNTASHMCAARSEHRRAALRPVPLGDAQLYTSLRCQLMCKHTCPATIAQRMHLDPHAVLPFGQLQRARATWNPKVPVVAAFPPGQLVLPPHDDSAPVALLEHLFGGEPKIEVEHIWSGL